MAVVALLNQKGGVGKTSTCYHLAGTFAKSGRRVLLVDADPQSSLTQGFFGPAVTRGLDPSTTIAAVLAGESPFVGQVLRPSGLDLVDLIPGSRAAADSNLPRPHESPWSVQLSIREFLEPVRATYDLIMVDCPPNLHLCSWAALVAADGLVVPLQPEDFGAQGIADVQESVARVIDGPNPSLALYGFLITMLSPRRAVHQLYVRTLREEFGESVFVAMVPESIDFVEAISQRKTVAQYKPRGAAAKGLQTLAAELAARIAAADSPSIGQKGAA